MRCVEVLGLWQFIFFNLFGILNKDLVCHII